MNRLLKLLLITFCVLLPTVAWSAQPGLPLLTVSQAGGSGQTYSLSIQVLLFMTALTMLPAGLMMMTSFARIIIVLAILRQALGTAQTPTNQILVGLALFLTFFIMAPVLNQVNQNALQPYLNKKLPAGQAMEKAAVPIKKFMLAQTRESDLVMFAEISGAKKIDKPANAPFSLVMPAFMTSELKTAFQIGFLLFIPFLIIDLAVASVLMSMGMMMLSPMIISLPFKLMLFVLVDGWALVMGTLATSFQV